MSVNKLLGNIAQNMLPFQNPVFMFTVFVCPNMELWTALAFVWKDVGVYACVPGRVCPRVVAKMRLNVRIFALVIPIGLVVY